MERYNVVFVVSITLYMTSRFVTVSYQLFALMVAGILTAEHVRTIDTVPQLNISQYIGRWYQVCSMRYEQLISIALCGELQMYADFVIDHTFGRNCICATANCK